MRNKKLSEVGGYESYRADDPEKNIFKGIKKELARLLTSFSKAQTTNKTQTFNDGPGKCTIPQYQQKYRRLLQTMCYRRRNYRY